MKKRFFYFFIFLNFLLIIWAIWQESLFSPEMIREFLITDYFVVSYLLYIFLLTLRGLTIIPGTPFIIAGVYLFEAWQVYFAIQLTVIFYSIIIFKFSHKLNFKIPKKISNYEEKIKQRQIPIIFSLCFIPGMPINVFIYFLSILKIKFKNIITGVFFSTAISTVFYIFLWKSLIETKDYFI